MVMEMPSAKTIVSAAASAAATAVVIRSMARDLLPDRVQELLWERVFSSMSSDVTVTIDQMEGVHDNHLFQAVDLYLGSKVESTPSSRVFRAAIPHKETAIVFSVDTNQDFTDLFNGVHFKWTKRDKETNSTISKYDEGDNRCASQKHMSQFELSFHKKHRAVVMECYFPYVLSQARTLKDKNRTLKIHTLKDGGWPGLGRLSWVGVNLDHPSTFHTLAMDLDAKTAIMEDLEMFVRRKDFYRKVGKAWKRGYLLYGPPGTGKSSLIAAMANYLNFDIFDLDLTQLSNNSELRNLLIRTANRSILVVEDIDCSVDLRRKKKHKDQNKDEVNLSGLLNFIDGLWSSCGDERVIIFTTNHKERLDPALLRPGRMDVHVLMSYCTPCGFKMLASNYLGVTHHPLFVDIEELIPEARVTPAEVGEQLMKTPDSEAALKGLVVFLKAKKEEAQFKANNPDTESDSSGKEGEKNKKKN